MPLPRKKSKTLSSRKSRSNRWSDLEEQISSFGGVWYEDYSLRLKDIKVIKYAEADNYFYFLADLDNVVECNCGASLSSMKRNGWTAIMEIFDLPLYTKYSKIYYRLQRYKCMNCKKTAQSTSVEIDKSHRMTRRLLRYIQKESMSPRTHTSIEREVGVTSSVIRIIQADYTVSLQKEREISQPSWIAIDEVFPTSRKEPRCVISAPLENRVLDLLIDNHQETLVHFLVQLRKQQKVEVVSIDMYNPYRAAVNLALKNVKIVVDRFHVQKIVNEALKDVISAIRESLTSTEKRQYSLRESSLLVSGFGTKTGRKQKRESKISPEETEKSKRALFDRFPEIAQAHALKEEFSYIFELKSFEKAKERAVTWLDRVKQFERNFYNSHKRECHNADVRPFSNVVSEFPKWFEEILNYVLFKDKFEKVVSNGYAENLNRRIKELNRSGYGYTFEVLRSKTVFGGFKVPEKKLNPLKTKSKRKPRVKSMEGIVNENANIAKIIDACEQSDKTIDLIPNPILDEKYSSRSPLEIDDSLGELDSRGVLVRKFKRSHTKVRLKKYDGNHFKSDKVLVNISYSQSSLLPLCEEPLENTQLPEVSNEVEKPSSEGVIDLQSPVVSPDMYSKMQNPNKEKEFLQISLFDISPEPQGNNLLS